MSESLATNKYIVATIFLSSVIVGGATGTYTSPSPDIPGLPEPIYEHFDELPPDDNGTMETFPSVPSIPIEEGNNTYSPPPLSEISVGVYAQ